MRASMPGMPRVMPVGGDAAAMMMLAPRDVLRRRVRLGMLHMRMGMRMGLRRRRARDVHAERRRPGDAEQHRQC